MAVLVLSYGCETTTKKQENKIQASEMAFLRGVKRCYKLDRIRTVYYTHLDVYKRQHEAEETNVQEVGNYIT